jgi:hypothetical protein
MQGSERDAQACKSSQNSKTIFYKILTPVYKFQSGNVIIENEERGRRKMKKSFAFSTIGIALIALALATSLATPVMACTKTLVDYTDQDGDGIIEVGEKVHFEIDIKTHNYESITAENVIMQDRFGAELEVVDWTCEGTYEEDPVFYTKGKSEKVFLYWYIGTHEPGEEAIIHLTMATDLNPAGKQEYTSPGTYTLNSGAVVKKIYDGVKYSWETGQLTIEVFAPD